ncbi:NAD(P)H-hydrate dehydratase [Marivirga salinae]|uniref:Bifunctional NAD(P)H-hydrate repair enzyme n=1 Tax=Marivirga salinarum TaxID=3059078 RepID=A0AA51NAI1_9BACT|nr:NAD(P)H-hydrate dehydratase [Marivirga sp. BDSF4-3]WMN11573.1 NAD(P)H-hydrate dehydratase [Marivirga sp. BDSF4-3]
MKILNVQQIREADQFTIKNEPIASIDLMERASGQVVNWVCKHFSNEHEIIVLAGSGNNGGDGLAIARLLSNQNYSVKVVLIMGESGSDDFEQNLDRLKSLKKVEILNDFNFSNSNNDYIFIDAIFGSGLSRPIEGDIAKFVQKVNEAKGIKLAVDIPSGVFADEPSPGETIFKSDFTLSFQVPKLAFMMAENQQYVGQFEILNIGLSEEFINNCISDYSIYELTKELKLLLKVDSIAHKGIRGRATIIAGGHAKMGAVILAAKGTLHSGIGLLSVQVCPLCIDIIQNQIPEALILEDENDYVLGSFLGYNKQDVLVFGPAIGFANKTIKLLEEILKTFKGQLILDADAITILAKNREMLELLPEGTILTPHHGEFKRLVGNYSNNFEALMQLKSFCKHHKVVVVLKGKFTAVCNEKGQVSFNTTGNQGMAKGGSGDLLCGILAGIAPRVQNPFETAKLAVYLHGFSGDISLKEYGENYMTPSTMISNLKDTFKKVEN